jgi:hypothetical protein
VFYLAQDLGYHGPGMDQAMIIEESLLDCDEPFWVSFKYVLSQGLMERHTGERFLVDRSRHRWVEGHCYVGQMEFIERKSSMSDVDYPVYRFLRLYDLNSKEWVV